MHLTSKQKRILAWVGYPLLVLVVFTFTLAYTFPYDRLKDKIVVGLQEKYDVSIASIEPTLVPGTIVIKTIVLRTRPKTPDEKPVAILIDELEVNVGLISAAFWYMDLATVGVEVNAVIEGGTLALEVEHEKGSKTLSVVASTKMLPLESLPGVTEAVGLPMTGGLNADVSLTLPKGKWAKASGKVKLSCVDCTVGDGVTKMKMKPNPKRRRSRRFEAFSKEGVTVPKLNLGAMLAEIKIKKGKGKIVTLAAKSADGFLNIEGEIDFKDPFKETLFPACMKFGFSDELKQREPKFMGIESGLPPKAKQEDGSYAIPTKGKLVALQLNVRKQCGGAKATNEPAKRDRPTITTKPDSPVKKKDDKDEKKLSIPELSKIDDDDDDDAKKVIKSGPTLSKAKPDEGDDEEDDEEEDDEDVDDEAEDEEDDDDEADEPEEDD